jgi:hypothetical protein
MGSCRTARVLAAVGAYARARRGMDDVMCSRLGDDDVG